MVDAILTDQQRRAILLREWQGLSYAEVGARLGVEFERDFWGTLQRTLDEFVAHLRDVAAAR